MLQGIFIRYLGYLMASGKLSAAASVEFTRFVLNNVASIVAHDQGSISVCLQRGL
jgi:hypothetical protein